MFDPNNNDNDDNDDNETDSEAAQLRLLAAQDQWEAQWGAHGTMSPKLRALFSRHEASSVIQIALDTLLRAGKVRTVKEQTKGRPIEWWEWAGDDDE